MIFALAVFAKPEAMEGVAAEEIEDLTKAVIPLKISGPLTAPKVRPDVEELLRQHVEEEVKDMLGRQAERPVSLMRRGLIALVLWILAVDGAGAADLVSLEVDYKDGRYSMESIAWFDADCPMRRMKCSAIGTFRHSSRRR